MSVFDMGAILSRWLSCGALCLGLFACGPSIPDRYVIERDIDAFAYRRYQHVLDIEFRIPDNAAAGHAATYVRRRGTELAAATAFVSVYERATSLAAEVRDRIRTLSSYEPVMKRMHGEWVWELESADDHWYLWVSSNHVVKVGSAGDIPSDILRSYLRIYSSDLNQHGLAARGASSAGPSRSETEETEEDSLPEHLREGSPR